MKLYRTKLKVQTAVLTPFQADTVFGHICWVIARLEGEVALQEFLQPFNDNNPPFILSDGFPSDYLPKPLSAEFTASDDDRKDVKKVDYISLDDFRRISAGESTKLEIEDVVKNVSSTHNTINRLTNTSGEKGSVYSLHETIIPEVSIYLKAISDEWKNRFIYWLKELSKFGFGRKKSIGKGQFMVEGVSDFNFDYPKDANGFVALSNFCPAENDPTDGLYKTFVKYGKLGEEFTFCGNPFKRPLTIMKTGSIFKTGAKPKEYYGRMIDKIAPAKESDVVQYGYAFAVPIKYHE